MKIDTSVCAQQFTRDYRIMNVNALRAIAEIHPVVFAKLTALKLISYLLLFKIVGQMSVSVLKVSIMWWRRGRSAARGTALLSIIQSLKFNHSVGSACVWSILCGMDKIVCRTVHKLQRTSQLIPKMLRIVFARLTSSGTLESPSAPATAAQRPML